MKKTDISKVLESIQNQVEKIEDRKTKEIVSVLYNLVEELVSKSSSLIEENQALKDEINKLKGEQGKPAIKPNKKKMVIFLQKKNGKKQKPQRMR